MNGWTTAADERWLARLPSVRNVVRQELAARFVAAHLPDRPAPLRVLDAGCGQGTQALRLARLGHEVDGVDPDPRMLEAFGDALRAEDPAVRSRVRLHAGRVEDLPDLLTPGSYDVVLCHGVLMYVADPGPLIKTIATMVAPGGIASILARNQAGIAVRAGFRGRWAEALAALQGEPAYINELGAPARADVVADLIDMIDTAGLELLAWYGVRVLSDNATLDANPPPGSDELATLLAAEELAGQIDPYRQVAPLFQVIAKSPPERATTST